MTDEQIKAWAQEAERAWWRGEARPKWLAVARWAAEKVREARIEELEKRLCCTCDEVADGSWCSTCNTEEDGAPWHKQWRGDPCKLCARIAALRAEASEEEKP